MWPESLVAGQLEEPQDEYGELSLQHLDFHFGNCKQSFHHDLARILCWLSITVGVFDAFTADETGTKEHDLMPPLVMIDFDYVKAATKEATEYVISTWLWTFTRSDILTHGVYQSGPRSKSDKHA